MYLYILFLATAVVAQRTTVDPSVLEDIFGPPLTTTSSPNVVTTTQLEDVTIDPSIIDEIFGKPKPKPVPKPTTTTNAPVTPFEDVTIDPSIIDEIFGKPKPTTTTNAPVTPFEDITVKPTDSTTEFKNENGESCKCVPYYLCDSNDNAVDANNKSVTGFGELDIRFGADDCQESTEKCCKDPKKEGEVTPRPTPTRQIGCGYRNPGGIDFTIKGGTGQEAGFGEFPWVVAVLDALNDSYVGVGVLIHPQVVMTGAHIVHNYGGSRLKIRAGEWDTQTIKERLKYQERIAQDVYFHSEFQRRNLKNDVALLRLAEPLDLDDHIDVICMPDQDESFDNYKDCIANGWGKDVFGLEGRYAVILKRVEVDMVPHAQCNTLLKRTRLGNKFRLHSSFVCAGGEEGKDTCKGDGGAPLACPIGANRYKLTGLVAWGIGCGQKDVPAVYAAVSAFRAWVDTKMAQWGLDTSGYNI